MEEKNPLISHFYRQSALAFKRILLLMVIYSGLRMAYFVYNWHFMYDEKILEVIWGFINGIRFDISAIISLNLVFILLWFLPARWQVSRLWRYSINFLFAALNTVLIALNLVDIELINFHARRLTPIFFTLTQDVTGQLPQLIAYYWWIALCIIALGALLAYLMPRASTEEVTGVSLKQQKAYIAVFAFFLFLGGHGALSAEGLTQKQAFEGSSDIGHLTLNTTFTFVKWRPVPIQVFNFFTPEEMKQILEARMRLKVTCPHDLVHVISDGFCLSNMFFIHCKS